MSVNCDVCGHHVKNHNQHDPGFCLLCKCPDFENRPDRLLMPGIGLVGGPTGTDEVRVTSSTGGQKGAKEARYDLIPVGSLEWVARLYGRGALKYDDHNWRKGYDWSLSYAALQRHANLFWGGEDMDPETGVPHMAAVAFHALALIDFMENQSDFDDRFITTTLGPTPHLEPTDEESRLAVQSE